MLSIKDELENTEQEYEGIKEVINLGKEKGYLLYEEVNNALSDHIDSPKALESILCLLGEAGIEVIGVHGRKLFETWEITESLLAEKKVNLKPVVSHRLSLADAATGFDLIANQQALKVLLIPDDAQLR